MKCDNCEHEMDAPPAVVVYGSCFCRPCAKKLRLTIPKRPMSYAEASKTWDPPEAMSQP